MRLYKVFYEHLPYINETGTMGEFFFFSRENAQEKFNELKAEGKKVIVEECRVYDMRDFEEELCDEVEKYRLKAKDKATWEIHTGDIVINRSQWREIKKRLLNEQ